MKTPEEIVQEYFLEHADAQGENTEERKAQIKRYMVEAIGDDRAQRATVSAIDYVDIVFDGPPAHMSGRFVEVEDSSGSSINIGEWVKRDDGYWVLRIVSEEEL